MSIHSFAGSGDLDGVKQSILNGTDVNYIDCNRWTPLHHAARYGRLRVVKYLLRKKANTDKTDWKGLTPLHHAERHGHRRVVEYLLCNEGNKKIFHCFAESGDLDGVKQSILDGTDVNYKDCNGWTPLHVACKNAKPTIVQFLLDHQADTGARDNNGETPLHKAAQCDSPSIIPIVENLIVHHADIEAKDTKGWTPLHVACKNAKPTIVQFLLDHQADTGARDNNGETPLHKAAQCDSPSIIPIVENLIVHHADIEAKDTKGWTPLHVACKVTNPTIVEFLLDHQADTGARDNNGETPLHRVARSNRPSVLRIVGNLIALDADIEAKDTKGLTPLHVACEFATPTIVLLLLDHEANTGARDNNGETPLHKAATWDYPSIVPIVETLLAHDADIEAKDIKGLIPLHVACEFGNRTIVQFLLDHQSDTGARDNNGETPLHKAATCDSPSIFPIVENLIAHDANIEANNTKGLTPLHVACENSNQNIVQSLLAFKADTEARDNEGETPLHKAAVCDNPSIVEYLIDHDADTEAKDTIENTPLHSCLLSELCDLQLATALVINGADLFTKNAENETPYAIAQRLQLKHVLRMFKRELETGLPKEMRYLKVDDVDFFKGKLRSGFYYSYVGKIMIVGNEGVGKTAITAILIGKKPSKKRKPTEGIDVHISRAAVDLKSRKLIPKVLSVEEVAYRNLVMRRRYGTPFRTAELNVDDTFADDEKEGNQECQDDEREERSSLERDTGVHHDNGSSSGNIIPKVKAPATTEALSFFMKTLKKLGIGKKDRDTITADMLKRGAIKAGKKGIHMMHLAPVIILDFAGQRVFYSTHQSFLTHRGIYVITINGSLQLDDEIKTESSIPGKWGKPTTRAYVKFWMSSILTYSRGRNNMFPKILICCTHKDQVPMYRIEQQRSYIYGEITKMFDGTSAMDHLVLQHEIFVNAMDPKDPEIEILKDALVEMMFEQPSWGEKIPKSWIHLEMMINKKVESGTKILLRKQLEEINLENPVQSLGRKELDLFLKVHHSQGDVIYFPLPGLRDHIIIYPAYIVDALKSIITEKRFCGGLRLDMINTMNKEGVLRKADIAALWNKHRDFLHHQGYFTSLMSYLDILAEPRIYHPETGTLLRTEFFFVPSLVTIEDITTFLKQDNLCKKCMGLSFKFHSVVLPPAVGFRFISCCIELWDVDTYESQRMLFSGMIVVVINTSLTMLVQVKEQRVDIFLIHEMSKFKIIPDIASRIRECLNDTLYRISDSYRLSSSGPEVDTESVPFHIEYPCFHIESPCYTEQKAEWVCNYHGDNVGETMTKWFVDRTIKECPQDCQGVTLGALEDMPSELQLAKLVLEMGWVDLRPTLLYLGMTENEIKVIEVDYSINILNIMFLCLRKWRMKTSNGTLQDIYTAIEASGSHVHSLCKVFRDKPLDLPYDILEREITDQDLDKMATNVIDESLLLSVLLGIDASYWLKKKEDGDKIVKINRDMLRKWRDEHRGKMRELAQAFINVGIHIGVILSNFSNKS